ncbi:MAG: hypothetical protein BMS9Abin05_0951 [Rhodothermia bacterium]|nr:MAG: hypothetical protein BMS9Abin05_0951 [Rhodothermia bacterium]
MPSPGELYLYPDLPASWDSVVLPVDKAKGLSSFDVIRRLRKITCQRKIGHAGTLDPMATGLLICMFGASTKRMREFLEMEKSYEGLIRLGETTASYDAETAVECSKDLGGLTTEQIRVAATEFIGELRQTTPIYSAVRHQGERLYRKARRGERVTTPTRDVSVYSLKMGDLEGSDISFEMTCSMGTYVRSIAHELGQTLGVGAHLIALRRTAIGEIRVDCGWSLENLNSCTAPLAQPRVDS